MPFIETPGANIHFEDSGSGEPIVLVTGLASDCRHWKKAIPMLEGYRTIILDNRGCGLTEYEGPFTIEDMADDIIAIIDSLGLEKVHLLGWSMGSHICLDIAARYPDRVMTLCLVGSYLKRPARSDYILRATAEGYLDGKISSEMVGTVLNTLIRTERWFAKMRDKGETVHCAEIPAPQKFADQLYAVEGYDPAEDASKINVPVLSVHGVDDMMTDMAQGDAISDLIPDCWIMRIAGQGHYIPPKHYFSEYLKFLESH